MEVDEDVVESDRIVIGGRAWLEPVWNAINNTAVSSSAPTIMYSSVPTTSTYSSASTILSSSNG